MPVFVIVILAVAGFAAINLAVMYFITLSRAKIEYADKLTRTSKDKWGRKNSCPENAEHSVMFDEGMAWAAAHKDAMRPLTVESCSLRLEAEFYDFKSDTSVIIIPGRAESIFYSYFFAEPYEKAGVNVLVIDTRAHGNSDGKYVGMGIGEIPDVIAWVKLLKELGTKKVIIHGICIGASTAVMVSTEPDCPPLYGIVCEGLFSSFYTIFKQRTKNGGYPTFMFLGHIYRLAKKNAGVDIKRKCPANVMDKMTVPALFMHSRADNASLPSIAEELYEKCTSGIKRVVWFEKGAHSHIRIQNKEKYDSAITDFIAELRSREA